LGGLLGAFCLAACSASPGPPTAGANSAPTVVDQFTGLKSKDLVALLGEPSLRRRDPPAELWQYRGTGCVLELYLYRDGDAYRVVRAETRGRSLAGDDGCTAAMLPRHPAPSSVRQSRL
jgi:hypothetical protein